MLNFNGDTAVYLLYSHARIASILKKAETLKGVSIADLKQKESIKVSNSEVRRWIPKCDFRFSNQIDLPRCSF